MELKKPAPQTGEFAGLVKENENFRSLLVNSYKRTNWRIGRVWIQKQLRGLSFS